jgi:hypothetical protein
MNGRFQFTLRHLLLTTTLLGICLGVGTWCYHKYDDRVRPVARDFDLREDRELQEMQRLVDQTQGETP